MTNKNNDIDDDSFEVFGKETDHFKWPLIIMAILILLLIILIDIYYPNL